MISRRTIFSLLLTLLLAVGIRIWAANAYDPCDHLGPSPRGVPKSVYVESGTRTIAVPCTYWIPRQSMRVQALLLFNAVLVLVFLISTGNDWARHRAIRRKAVRL